MLDREALQGVRGAPLATRDRHSRERAGLSGESSETLKRLGQCFLTAHFAVMAVLVTAITERMRSIRPHAVPLTHILRNGGNGAAWMAVTSTAMTPQGCIEPNYHGQQRFPG